MRSHSSLDRAAGRTSSLTVWSLMLASKQIGPGFCMSTKMLLPAATASATNKLSSKMVVSTTRFKAIRLSNSKRFWILHFNSQTPVPRSRSRSKGSAPKRQMDTVSGPMRNSGGRAPPFGISAPMSTLEWTLKRKLLTLYYESAHLFQPLRASYEYMVANIRIYIYGSMIHQRLKASTCGPSSNPMDAEQSVSTGNAASCSQTHRKHLETEHVQSAYPIGTSPRLKITTSMANARFKPGRWTFIAYLWPSKSIRYLKELSGELLQEKSIIRVVPPPPKSMLKCLSKALPKKESWICYVYIYICLCVCVFVGVCLCMFPSFPGGLPRNSEATPPPAVLRLRIS